MSDAPTTPHSPADQTTAALPSSGTPSVVRAVLDFEHEWWRYAGDREAHVREAFGHGTAEHLLLVNALIDRPDAMAYDPLLVRRLRRQRTRRQRQRSEARLRGF